MFCLRNLFIYFKKILKINKGLNGPKGREKVMNSFFLIAGLKVGLKHIFMQYKTQCSMKPKSNPPKPAQTLSLSRCSWNFQITIDTQTRCHFQNHMENARNTANHTTFCHNSWWKKLRIMIEWAHIDVSFFFSFHNSPRYKLRQNSCYWTWS